MVSSLLVSSLCDYFICLVYDSDLVYLPGAGCCHRCLLSRCLLPGIILFFLDMTLTWCTSLVLGVAIGVFSPSVFSLGLIFCLGHNSDIVCLTSPWCWVLPSVSSLLVSSPWVCGRDWAGREIFIIISLSFSQFMTRLSVGMLSAPLTTHFVRIH